VTDTRTRPDLPEGASTVAVAAPDVDFAALPDGRCRVGTGRRTVTVEAGPDAVAVLSRIVSSVLPRLTRARPLAEQLSEAELATVLPHLGFLRSAGVLLFPGDAVAGDLGTDEELRLYTYLSRRTATPDRLYRSIRSGRVDLLGPEDVVEAWAELLRHAGMPVGTVGPLGADPAPSGATLTVVVSVRGDDGTPDRDPLLREVNARWCAAGERWVPVLVGPRTVRLGPWTAPGSSACLRCLAAPHRGDPLPVRAVSGPVRSTWATLQPGALAWAGGFLAHLALRTCVPVGPNHPWGGVTLLDTERLEQSTTRAWRDPSCPDCGAIGRRVQAWAEV
jgi:bacteriocin biosynthesis cyclodehydratase domain-containing protein